MQSFIPTEQCRRLPAYLVGSRPPKPVPHLSNVEVDQCLEFMLSHGAHDMQLPTTQYGRRVAVDAHLTYERIHPVTATQKPWHPTNPTQPR